MWHLLHNSAVFYEGDIFSVKDIAPQIKNKNIAFCATCRTTTFRVAGPGLFQEARAFLHVLSANHLTPEEIKHYSDLIDEMGFWPSDLARMDRTRREEILAKNYESSLSAILIKIFENEKIAGMVKNDWEKINPQLSKIRDHFIVNSYFRCIDVEVPSYIINQFQNIDYGSIDKYESDIVKNHLDGTISFNNAIIGEFVFKNYIPEIELSGAIVRFCNFINEHPSQRNLQWTVRRLLRYTNLARILNSPKKPLDVFDKASFVSSVASDPLFWVQYSIAQLANDNWPAAERHVSKAYDVAKQRKGKFDTYQIDTHAARLKIQHVVTFGTKDGDSANIRQAIRLLHSVIGRRPDDSYHVSTVIVTMLKSGVHWHHVLKAEDHKIVASLLREIYYKLNANAPTETSFASEREAAELLKNFLVSSAVL